jgi:hypothetical protein
MWYVATAQLRRHHACQWLAEVQLQLAMRASCRPVPSVLGVWQLLLGPTGPL